MKPFPTYLPVLGNRDPSSPKNPVQRRLFPQRQPEMPKQESSEGLDVEGSIELLSVTSKIKKSGLSNLQSQEPVGQGQQRARSKSFECLHGHYDLFTDETTEAETISSKPALGDSNPSPLQKSVQRRLVPQEQLEMPEQESFDGLDAEDCIDLPSVTSKVKKGGFSNLQLQEPAGQRQQKARSKSSECLHSHYDLSTEETTEAETISNKPALGNSTPSTLKKPVQRRLFPHEHPEMLEQESFEGLDAEDSIELPSVTSKVKKYGLSNLQSQERAGQRQQRARSKSFECLHGHYDLFTEETTEAETISNRLTLGNSNPSPLKSPVQKWLIPQGKPGMPEQGSQGSFEGLDAEASIELPSVTLKVKKSGLSSLQSQEPTGQRHQRAHSTSSKYLDVEDSIGQPSVTSTVKKSGHSNLQSQEPAGQRQQRANSKPFECLDVEDSFKLPSRSPKVKGNGSGDALPQDTPTVQNQEVHTKDSEVFIPQDGNESSSFVLNTERSGCDDSLQHCSTASSKLLEAIHREFLSQRPKSQAQERDLTLKKPSEPRKEINARGQEPENTDYGMCFWAKVFKSDDRTHPKSFLLCVDGKIQKIPDLRVGKCVGFTPKKFCNNPIKKLNWETTFSTLEEKINKRGSLDWEGEIHLIAESLFCYHHKSQASYAVNTLRTDYKKWIGTDEPGFIQSEIKSSSRDTSQGKEILYISRGPTTRSQTKGQTKKIPVLETFVFKPYPQKRQNLADRIREVMIKELSRQDNIDGLIYIYWIPGNQQIPEGLVKIGVTNVTVASRLEVGNGWRKCHPDLVHKYPTKSIKFPHACRVERLIHAELSISRHKQIGCLHCDRTSHVELFAVPLAQAIEVTKRWTKWACGLPYDKNGRIRIECIPRIAYN